VEVDGKSNAVIALKTAIRYYAMPADTGNSVIITSRPTLNHLYSLGLMSALTPTDCSAA